MKSPPLEIELKFKVAPELLERMLGHRSLQGAERAARMRSVYFDTASHQLRRRGLTLRVRDDGEGFVQTVKHQIGPGGVSRGEWEARVASDQVAPEALANTPAGEVLRGKVRKLAPLFSTVVDRRTRTLSRRGAIIEAAFDQGTVSVGDRGQPICEVELESKRGDPAVLFKLGRRLANDFSINLSFDSKAERGYRLAAGAGVAPKRAETPWLAPDTPTAEAFRRIARACLAQICANAELLCVVRRPEAIHQIRVGLRRFRAALAAFKAILSDDARAAIETELKWFAGELDPARDLDVFIQEAFRPAAAGAADSDFAPLGFQLLKAQTDAYDRAVAAVRSRRYAALLVDTAEWIELGAWSRSADAVLVELRSRLIKPFAIDALDHLWKVVRRRGRRFAQLDRDGRHKLRIRAKRLRYAAEFFSPLFEDHPKRAATFLVALQRMQSKLGALNDIAVGRQRVLREACLNRPDLAFAAGRVIGWRENDEVKLLRLAGEEILTFLSAAPFWRARG
jgi:inorganic triphosphatase YgiF